MRELSGTLMRHSGDFWGGLAAMLVALPASVAFGVTVYSAVAPHYAAFGALAMLGDGLFERFPCDAMFAMHNEPGLPVGEFATRGGAFYANVDRFVFKVTGKGAHAARPHEGKDAILLASQLVMAVSRMLVGGPWASGEYFIGPFIGAALWPLLTKALLLPQRRGAAAG